MSGNKGNGVMDFPSLWKRWISRLSSKIVQSTLYILSTQRDALCTHLVTDISFNDDVYVDHKPRRHFPKCTRASRGALLSRFRALVEQTNSVEASNLDSRASFARPVAVGALKKMSTMRRRGEKRNRKMEASRARVGP